MSERVVVPLRFRQAWSRYNAGEQAGFGAVRAHELVKHGIAEYASPQQAQGVEREQSQPQPPQAAPRYDAEAQSNGRSGGAVGSEPAPATVPRRRRS